MEGVSGAGDGGRTTGWGDVSPMGRARNQSDIKGRDGTLEELRELASSAKEVPRLVVLEGPRGAGTSTLAGELVGQVKRTWQRSSRDDPVVIHVNVSSLNHTHGDPSLGVATCILRKFNVDFSPKGYPTGQVAQWALRRISVQPKPVVVWLDQVHEITRIMAGALEPLLEPERFLETRAELPSILVVVSGIGKAQLGSWSESVATRWIHLPPLPRETIRIIVEDRAIQAGRVFTPGAMAKVEDILLTSGMGVSVLDEVLRDAVPRAGCHGIVTEGDVAPPASRVRHRRRGKQVELHMLEVLRKAGGRATMGELTDGLSRAFVEDGECVPTGSSIRRWMSRLEQLGVVERTVKMGGDGGTRSVVALARGACGRAYSQDMTGMRCESFK